MNKKILVNIVLVLIAILVVITSIQTMRPKPNVSSSHAVRKIALGVWTEGLYDAKTRTLHPEKLLEFEEVTEKKFTIAHYYRGWESFTDPVLLSELDDLRRNGWTPMLNANPYYFADCPVSDKPLYRAIADGQCDEFLRKSGKNLALVSKPFFLLFAWEMNNKDLEWSVPYTGSTTQDFVRAWRHVHMIFEEERATNVVWVFCPNIPDVSDAPYIDLYPGDAYVDWTCLDGYNWGTTQSWSQWSSFSGVYKGAYDKLVAIAPDKPFMIGEVNTTDQGGNKADWYRDMFLEELPHNFPQVKAVVIFNEKRDNERVNWKVDISPESFDAFKEGIHAPYYK